MFVVVCCNCFALFVVRLLVVGNCLFVGNCLLVGVRWLLCVVCCCVLFVA